MDQPSKNTVFCNDLMMASRHWQKSSSRPASPRNSAICSIWIDVSEILCATPVLREHHQLPSRESSGSATSSKCTFKGRRQSGCL
jgi:hypothetical protein